MGQPLFHEDKAAAPPLPPPRPAVVEQVSHAPVPLPAWVLNTPEECFVGISPPCGSQAEARQQAVGSALAQVLQAMGADYDLRIEAKTKGSATTASHQMDETLRYTARWLLQEVQQGVKQTIIQQQGSSYLAYVLMEVQPEQLARLRRLTVGARLSARVVSTEGATLDVEVRESNGVAVTLTDYRLEARTTNHHARAITLFAFKVPESDHWEHRSGLAQAMRLQSSAARQAIAKPVEGKGFKQAILGSQTALALTLSGHDQLGRPVAVTVEWR